MWANAMKYKWISAAVVVLAGAGYLLLKPEPALQLALVQVQRGKVEARVANTRAGTIKACRRALLSLSVGGPIARLPVTEGDRVEAGQLLLALWQDDLRAAVAQADAAHQASRERQQLACLQAQFARREAQRLNRLASQKLASANQADKAETEAQTAEANCQASRSETRVTEAVSALARANLAKSELHAPFAGVIAEVNGEEGEYLIPSPPGVATLPAIDLIDDSCLFVSAPIDEVDAARLEVGQHAYITLDAFPGETFAGRVRRIAPYVLDLEKQARTVEAEIVFTPVPADRQLLIGYSADVEIVTAGADDSLYLPSEAVLADDSVYRVDGEGRLERVAITPGLRNWQQIGIVAGVSQGDWIVRQPGADGVAAGKRVSPAEDNAAALEAGAGVVGGGG